MARLKEFESGRALEKKRSDGLLGNGCSKRKQFSAPPDAS
jgi:hypothetical protein